MKKRHALLLGGIGVVLLAIAAATPARADQREFTLAGAVPNDVFICVTGKHNPDRKFLEDYWGEVIDELKRCGIGDDVLKLIGSFMDADQQAEFDRFKARATELIEGVDWHTLAGKEMAFGERFPPAMQISQGNVNLGPPEMVWLCRGSSDGAAHNFKGLVAILQGLADEVNNVAGPETLVVETSTIKGTTMAGINLLAKVPGAPRMNLVVALHNDVIFIGFGDQIIDDVRGLLDGHGSKTAMADDPRYKAAFAKLPPAEDSMVFFDMQALLKPIGKMMTQLAGIAAAEGDVYRNDHINPEANKVNVEALTAYQNGDFKQALKLIEKAHRIEPKDSVILYNLACFHALDGNQSEALDCLHKSVEAGFYAPVKIKSDSDLISIREDPRFEAAIKRAGQLAAQYTANDIILNSVKSGQAHELNTQAWQVYEQKDYEKGLELVEQAYEIAPTDSRVLYYLACFHALLGHDDKALDFLNRAVEGGFHCPNHISGDPDLTSIRDSEGYRRALATARDKAAQFGEKDTDNEIAIVMQLVERLMNAVGVLDYTAAVKSTDGYTVKTETVAVLVDDARQRPIYPVLCSGKQLTRFDRYLPEETMSFSVSGGFDIGALYEFVLDTIRELGPKGEEALEKWAAIQTEVNLDVEQDVLGWIGDEFVTATLENEGGSVLLISVTDDASAREKISAAIEFVSTMIGKLGAQNPGLAMINFTVAPSTDERLEDFQELRMMMSPEPLVWGTADGHLIFGTSADAVALCLATARGEHPNIRENERVMSEAIVPTGGFTSVTLTDQRGLGTELAMGIGMLSMGTGMMAMAVPDPDIQPIFGKVAGMLGKLTPVVRKIDFFKSTASCTTFDGQAWHSKMVTNYFSPEERAGTQTP